MRLSSATIDCWLQISGTGTYSDFQHHHWDIGGPSGPIGTAIGNRTTYIWTLDGNGNDSSGSWSAINQSKTIINGAEVRISAATNPPNMVALTQATVVTSNQLHETGSTKATDHPVEELQWPADLTWDPNHAVPSSVTWRDMGQPGYKLVETPFPAVPGPASGTLLLLENISLLPDKTFAIGGRNWTSQPATFFQCPGCSALAWWAWTINLVA